MWGTLEPSIRSSVSIESVCARVGHPPRLVAQSGLSFAVAHVKLGEAAILAAGAPSTSGTSATVAAGLALSASGNIAAGGIQLAGAFTGRIGETDKAASIATTLMSITGPIVLTATGGDLDRAAKWSQAEALFSTGSQAGYAGQLFDKGASLAGKLLQSTEIGQNLLDLFGIEGACK